MRTDSCTDAPFEVRGGDKIGEAPSGARVVCAPRSFLAFAAVAAADGAGGAVVRASAGAGAGAPATVGLGTGDTFDPLLYENYFRVCRRALALLHAGGLHELYTALSRFLLCS